MVDFHDLDVTKLPRHIAIIMDGNGRWADTHGVSHTEGHNAGAKSVRAVIEGCRELCIPYLTLYAFSTENWRRPKYEITALFRLISKYIVQELDELHRENIRVITMGKIEHLPAKAQRDIAHAVKKTSGNTAMTLNVALNYGSRAEIVDAVRGLLHDQQSMNISPDEIDESTFSRYLYQPELPDPDLLIRTSGEMRLSNFMLWQLSYAEIVVTETLWPDFGKEHLYDVLKEYQSRSRRFGGRTTSSGKN